MLRILGLICAILLPLFNIPLIARVVRRRSSEDISLVWVVGVWVCFMGMLPSSLRSPDAILVAFSIVNAIFFSGVLGVVLFFHPSVRKKRQNL